MQALAHSAWRAEAAATTTSRDLSTNLATNPHQRHTIMIFRGCANDFKIIEIFQYQWLDASICENRGLVRFSNERRQCVPWRLIVILLDQFCERRPTAIRDLAFMFPSFKGIANEKRRSHVTSCSKHEDTNGLSHVQKNRYPTNGRLLTESRTAEEDLVVIDMRILQNLENERPSKVLLGSAVKNSKNRMPVS